MAVPEPVEASAARELAEAAPAEAEPVGMARAGREPVDAVPSAAPAEAAQGGRPADAQAELPWAVAAQPALVAQPPGVVPEAADVPLAAEAPASAGSAAAEARPVPANDVVSGPVIQPIVIGSESAPPLERKRGWWRRR